MTILDVSIVVDHPSINDEVGTTNKRKKLA